MAREITLAIMPDGSVDWRVFNERRAALRSLLDRGRCVGCDGKAPSAEASAYCVNCRRDASRIEEKKRSHSCSFCGGAAAGAIREPLYVDYPFEVVRCHDCRGRKMPETSEAVGHGRLFDEDPEEERSWGNCADVIVRDGDGDGELGQYVMAVTPQPGQAIEDAVKAAEIEAWAHNHGSRRHGAPVKAWFVMLSDGWRRIPFRTRSCQCQQRGDSIAPRCLVRGLLKAEGLSLPRRIDILY